MPGPVRRTARTNALLILGIAAAFVVLGVYLWMRWDAAALSGDAGGSSHAGALWGLVIIGGPVVLLGAVIWGKLHNRPASRDLDPATPSDDPSKGMSGHD